ncbi:peptidyl-prolyl cis-trans isomerase (rotamase) - cyclophilin family [Belliella baltica DSM 15883]|uniref:Peptidyl-prolyl cis-trans isomerase n=1 Tax=Belliella baltica (strain DSM 15883 / CIP 108006 / LMG 21964 / BA134) TaxID=866536 RepID=I3Z161_BELBD|nr:peptidylprolyl isomerase [Belliella baltica]AFL82979.1 peptidyl-prolyl cis-trans isomerase (rotamase) - cyclophilin family [Belliella baltica DSM 15883]
MKLRNLFLIGLSILAFSSCSVEKDYLIKIETRHGDMYALLFDETPKHKSNFIELAENGRFDSTQFHRVIENFMVQGGDVFGKENLPRDEWYTIPEEINPELIHGKGMIAAARMGNNVNPERASSGSQFYIVQGKVYDKLELVTDMRLLGQKFNQYISLESNKELRENYYQLYQAQELDSMNKVMLSTKTLLEDFYNINLDKKMTPQQIETYTTDGGTPHLDNEYTVFGKIIKGLDVMETIAKEKTGLQDKPLEPVYIKVSVSHINKKKITKEFGYTYE